MRTRIVILTSAALLGAASALPAQSLANPDFELPGTEGQTPAGWPVIRGKLFLDSAKRNTGMFSGKFDGGNGAALAEQEVVVSPGATYQFSGFWRNGDRTADFDRVVAEVRWLTAPGGRDLGQAANADSGNTLSEWTAFQLPLLTAPPGAGAARIVLTSRFGIGAFDSLFWGRPGAPPPALLSAPAVPATPGAEPAPFSDISIPPLSEVLAATPAPAPTVLASSPRPTAAAAKPPSGVARQSGMVPLTSISTAPSRTVTALSTGGGTTAGGMLNWSTDLRAARRSAAAEQKRILVFFSGEEEALLRLERQVFGQPEVIAAMARFIPVKLDFEKNKNLAFALQVSTPGTVTIYDAKGEFLLRLDAPFTAEDIVGRLKALGN